MNKPTQIPFEEYRNLLELKELLEDKIEFLSELPTMVRKRKHSEFDIQKLEDTVKQISDKL